MSRYINKKSKEVVTLVETGKDFCKISFDGITIEIPRNRFEMAYERVEDENKSDKEI